MAAEEAALSAAFVAGGVGTVGLLPAGLPPLHAINDPITTAIASRFILASTV